MKAAMFYNPGEMGVIEIEKPGLSADEILLKVHAAGFCGTDYSIYHGTFFAKFPLILGHEYAGEVVEIGEGVEGFEIGDKVVADPNIFCGKCFYCRKGEVHLCKSMKSLGVTINGGFAEYSVVPVSNAYKLGNNISYEEGALIEPLACCTRGIEQANIRLGDKVVILGAGAIGNMMIQLAKSYGASKIIVSEVINNRGELALKLGADYVFDPLTVDVEKEIKKIFPEGADIVIECTGNAAVQERSIYMVRRGGTVVIFASSPEDQIISVSPFYLYHNAIKMIGTVNNPFTHEKAINLVSSKKIILENLISHKIPLEKIGDVFGIFGTKEAMKILIVPNY